MFWLVLFLVISVGLNIVQGRFLYVAARRLLQFDELWQQLLPGLTQYSADIHHLATGNLDGILFEHPEVMAFHKRNLAMLGFVGSVMDSVQKMVPPRRRRPGLPRPDME